MNQYEIVIDYKTGNSFGNEDVIGESTGIVTTDLSKAKENIKRIKQHFMANVDEFQNCCNYEELTLLTDKGAINIQPFWVGYFETLHKAYIVTKDDDMSFTPKGY